MMRKPLILSAMLALALAGCGGGGGGNTTAPPPVTPTNAPTNLVTPQFSIVVPGRTGSGSLRSPKRVSSAANSVTITRTTQPGVTPTSVTTDLATIGHACTVATPCVVNGPPSPPGVSNTFNIQTFASHDGSGTALDFGSVTFTPTVGTNNTQSVTLKGIPNIVTIGALPTTFNAGTGSGVGGSQAPQSPQTASLSVTVQDAASQTITGPYQNNVVITDPDAETYGTSLTGSPCSANVCTLTSDTDAAAVTFNYKGVAENPVTLTSSGTGLGTAGTATFTPVLQPIVWAAGPSSLYTGNSPVTAPVNQGCGVATACGVDLYALTGTGSTGTESYSEPGYTTTPYNKTLTTINGTSCAAFASVTPTDNTATGRTDFAATATSATAGVCLRVVSDGLAAANHGSGGPAFVVTYTTSGISASAKHRQQR